MPFFDSLPDELADPTSGRVVARFLDGLGFRFRWATEGLGDEDYAYRPHTDCMSIGEIVAHVWGIVHWVENSVFPERAAARPEGCEAQRRDVLAKVAGLRTAFASMEDAELLALRIGKGLPFWNMLNGPIADALTHVGQINSFRRLAGNPTPKANVFLGRPPAK